MSSSRLPGKSLALLGRWPVLEWVVRRVGDARQIDRVVVATSCSSEDDSIEEAVTGLGALCIRGPLHDVLGRYEQAAQVSDAATVVRITGDCPFVSSEIIDSTIGALSAFRADYASTTLDGRFPRGLDSEAFRREALAIAANEAHDPIEREHVTPYIYRRSGRFKCSGVPAPSWACHPSLRFTVDEAADLQLARTVVEEMGANPRTSSKEIIDYLILNPAVAQINSTVQHRTLP